MEVISQLARGEVRGRHVNDRNFVAGAYSGGDKSWSVSADCREAEETSGKGGEHTRDLSVESRNPLISIRV
jgi:hypothetical protein